MQTLPACYSRSIRKNQGIFFLQYYQQPFSNILGITPTATGNLTKNLAISVNSWHFDEQLGPPQQPLPS
jgi:hypothetical protein